MGSPKILNPMSANVTSAFAANVRVGTLGSPYEAGMEGAELALNAQANVNGPRLQMRNTCNDSCSSAQDMDSCLEDCIKTNPIDFLRPEAYLYIIFVSDEDDQSSQDVRYFWRAFETAKGIGNDGTVTTAAIIGDVPTNNCGATPGARYKALSDLTGGVVGSVCDTSFSATLKNLANNAVGLKRTFPLSAKPDPSSIVVTVKYPCNLSDSDLSKCAMVDHTTCDSGDPNEMPTSVDLACTPPQGGTDGWKYEADKNDIYFAGDSVPGVKGEVEIQYCKEGTTCG
jgi:hypothetical protein